MQKEYNDTAIPLAELVAALRQELVLAIAQGQGQAVQFTLGDIELELNVGVSRQATAQGGVQFWVFTLGANASATASTTHTIRLTLKAQTSGGADIRIHGETSKLEDASGG
jgi:Trypsin-co-occurring domain 2